MPADELQEIRRDVSSLHSVTAVHASKIDALEGLRADVDAFKEIRPGQRLSGLETKMDKVEKAAVETQAGMKAMTGAFEDMAGEAREERRQRLAAAEAAAAKAAQDEIDRKKKKEEQDEADADTRRKIMGFVFSERGFVLAFLIISALGLYTKGELDKAAYIEAVQTYRSVPAAPSPPGTDTDTDTRRHNLEPVSGP